MSIFTRFRRGNTRNAAATTTVAPPAVPTATQGDALTVEPAEGNPGMFIVTAQRDPELYASARKEGGEWLLSSWQDADGNPVDDAALTDAAKARLNE